MELLFNNLDKLLDAPNGIEKASQLILQLAVQGKLTEQDPNDEPASELLKKIKKEKEKHLKERGMRPDDFNYPTGFKQIPHKLPNNWEWVTFGELVLIIRGITFPSSAKFQYPSEGLCVCLRTTNVQKIVDWNKLLYVPNKYVKNDYQWVEKNDILISMANSRELVGKVSLVDNVPMKATFGGFISVIRSFIIDPVFLWYALSSSFFQSSLRVTSSQTTNIANISLRGIKPLPFPLPPLNEQKRIVEKVNSLMALLDEIEEKRARRNQKRIKLNNSSLDKLLTSKDDKELKTNWKRIEENFSTLYSVPENVAKLKQAILQLAVQGKLTSKWRDSIFESHPELVLGSVKSVRLDDGTIYEPASELLKKIKKEKEKLIAEGKIKKKPARRGGKELPAIKEDEKQFGLPKGWEWVSINDIIGEAYTGLERSRSEQSLDNAYYYFKMNNIGNDGQCLLFNMTKVNANDEEVHKYKLTNGDFLFNTRNSYELVGKTCVYKNDKKETVLFNNNIYKMNYLGKLDKDYANIFFNSPIGKLGLDKLKSSTTNVAAIYQGKLMTLLFALPPLNEQKRIVEKVNELMSLCNALEEKLTKKEEKGERLVGAVVNGITNN